MSKRVYFDEKRKAMLRLCNANGDLLHLDSGTFFEKIYSGGNYEVFAGKYMAIVWNNCPFPYGGSNEFFRGQNRELLDVCFSAVIDASSSTKGLTMPTLQEIKVFLKKYREEHRGERGIPDPIYTFKEGVSVNAKWLKDILVVISDYDDERFYGSFTSEKAPIYIEKRSETVAAILLPVYRNAANTPKSKEGA